MDQTFMLWGGSHEQILIPKPCVVSILLFPFTYEVTFHNFSKTKSYHLFFNCKIQI